MDLRNFPLTFLYVLDAFVLTHDEFEVFCWPLFSSVLLQQMASNRVIFQTWVAKPFGSPLGAPFGGFLGGHLARTAAHLEV